MDDVLLTACEGVFRYPNAPPPRRHGPRGYLDYQSCKPWLRDEFAFRCIYCLWRERWEADGHHGFGVDHLNAQSAVGKLPVDYDQLVYACNTCNSTRRDVPLPVDPTAESLAEHLRISIDGTVEGLTAAGEDIIALCRLNRELLVAARQRILALIPVLQKSNHPAAIQALRDLFAFPIDLPNLATLRPPGGNPRSVGVADSFFERRRRGELPDVY